MKDLYYTPTLKEFHIGFQYEWFNEDKEWVKVESPEEITPEGYDEQTYGLRVKYLDTDDIESLGFIKRGKTWAGYVDYEYTEFIDGKVPYYLRASIHVPLMDDMYKIILHRILEEDTNIDKAISQGESEVMFRGRIKNKSELKFLMSQVGIYEY